MTNGQCAAYDAASFRFESAGALAFVNEGSGSAVPPARSMACAARQRSLSRLMPCVALEVTMTRLSTQDFAACMGIDWADATPAVCLPVAGADTRHSRVLAHTPEASGAWARTRCQRFGGRPMAVCLELTNGPLVSARRAHALLVLFPVNALTVAKYRQAFTPSRAKDDPSEAEIPLERLRKPRDKLQGLTPPRATRRTLDQLVACRRRLGEDKVRLTNRLTSALNNYVPQVLSWFSDKETTIFGDVLAQWPTLQP
jgi:hypothetical protein